MHSKPTVPGFPELQYEYKCKVCQLAKFHPGILKLIHQYRKQDGYGESAILNRTRVVFERHGVMPPSERSLGRHIKKHIEFPENEPDQDDYNLPDPEEVRIERLAAEEVELRKVSPQDIALGKNDSDYHNMADLFRRLMRRISALDADPNAFTNPDGRHDLKRLDIWSKMIANAKSIIEGLNKMRNSDRMTVSILEQHTKRYASAVVGPIGEALRGVLQDLQDINDPKARELSTRLTLLLDRDVTDIFTEAAIKSLRESKEQYKLLN